jgi:transposase-like protein
MYSYEGRLRAVRLYIKLGLRVGPTIRQLGYPTKNSLKSWHQEYVQRHDLAAGHERTPKYSQAQKARRPSADRGKCVPCGASFFGIGMRRSQANVGVVSQFLEFEIGFQAAPLLSLCIALSRRGSRVRAPSTPPIIRKALASH